MKGDLGVFRGGPMDLVLADPNGVRMSHFGCDRRDMAGIEGGGARCVSGCVRQCEGCSQGGEEGGTYL